MNQKCSRCGETFVESYYFRHLNKCQRSKRATEVNFDEFKYNTSNISYKCPNSNIEQTLNDSTNQENVINEDEQNQRNLVFECIEEFASEEVINEMMNGLYDNTEPESQPTSHQMAWLVYFLAFWQYTYSITDTAMKSLITFLHVLFKILIPSSVIGMFPRSLYLFQKEIGFPKNSFKKYVVCTQCHKLYHLEDCSFKLRGEMHSKKCDNILYPEHPQKARRKECGQLLMKTIVSPTGKKTLYPFKIYCYKSLKENLQSLLRDPTFEDKCEAWRKLEKHPDVLSDVYDGRVWKHFSDEENGYPFLNEKRNYGLC
ncbi:uncharacterized protein [Clytia hemisphaerica]|uniref:Uncharacterized protein n=1 Tax=Clytia hemisphaerica TaxID=252671 RepID=A0A7M5V2U9_9CNID|eukprot:TCONS_00027446-protein